MTGTLHEKLFTFMAISRWITLTMTNVSNKRYTETQNTRFMFRNTFRKTRAVYMVKPVMAQITIWRMRVACWINEASRTKAHARAPTSTRTHAHTHAQKYVILIAFTWQQWFRERASVLRYTYIACLVENEYFLSMHLVSWGIRRSAY
jgi:hypothetical protein